MREPLLFIFFLNPVVKHKNSKRKAMVALLCFACFLIVLLFSLFAPHPVLP
jgi:integral membrane sensor domain MASE1